MLEPVPLLLLPGLMNDERVWQGVRGPIEQERRVVVATTHQQTGVDAVAAAAIATMPAGPFAVAGFSLGGYVALEICRQAAERVCGLALLSTGHRAETAEGIQNRRRMIDGVSAGVDAGAGAGAGRFRQVAEGFLPRVVHPSHLDDSTLRDLLTDMASSLGAQGFIRQQTTAMTRPDSTQTLRHWRRPTLVLCGEQDRITPTPLSQDMARLVAGATLVVVPDSGHMVMLEQPGPTLAALRLWLTAVDAG